MAFFSLVFILPWVYKVGQTATHDPNATWLGWLGLNRRGWVVLGGSNMVKKNDRPTQFCIKYDHFPENRSKIGEKNARSAKLNVARQNNMWREETRAQVIHKSLCACSYTSSKVGKKTGIFAFIVYNYNVWDLVWVQL